SLLRRPPRSTPMRLPSVATSRPSELSFLNTGAVYPRWRGEHELDNVDSGSAAGLSTLEGGTVTP
ncbi:hypothetical protein NSP71_27535, partial [Salmonella enterica]|nr:hypothetical protein [Salmonella enterica]